jgi:hypothetical protein
MFMRVQSGPLFGAVLMMTLLTSAADAGTLLIRTFDRRGDRGVVNVSAGAEKCALSFSGSDRWIECALRVPNGTTTLQLEGELKVPHYKGGHRQLKGKQQVKIIDLHSATAPLRDATKPFSARTIAVADALRALTQSDLGSISSPRPELAWKKADPLSALQHAEERLGFKLPAEHIELLSTAGALEIDDSSMGTAESLHNAYAQMRDEWGTDEGDLKRLSEKLTSFLKGSVMLFTEVGDGYGALLFQPADPACEGRGAYYWIHQDEMSPERVKERDGSCGDYTHAVSQLLSRFVLEGFDDHGSDVLLFDSSAPGGFTTQMALESGEQFEMKFTAVWE